MFASPWKDGLIVLIIVLLFFGPKRLPALSRSIGESIREFKGGIAPGPDSEKSELPTGTRSDTGTVGAPAAEARETGAASEPTNV
jgi:TatA/E family protein of Tat protein translocase